MLRRIPPFFLIAALALTSGCRSEPPHPDVEARAIALAIASGLQPPEKNEAVQARVVPPVGWKAEPLKLSNRHAHQIWISPSGDTAYGVIYFSLPWPVGPDLALWGFLQQMQRVEGRAILISKQSDDQLPGLRFVAEGGRYTVRTNLLVSGFHAWAIYAGTMNDKPIDQNELTIASLAREQTRIGLP